MTDPQVDPEVPEEEVAGIGPATEPPAGEAADLGEPTSDETSEGGSAKPDADVRAGETADAASDPLAEAMSTIASLEDQLARRGADLYNLEQEYNGFVRRSKADGLARREEGVISVVEALLPVLDDAELARQHGDLTGPLGAIIDKLEQTLRASFGVERYGAIGEEFDPQIHEALMHSSGDVEADQVGTLIQPGYRIGGRVVRPARVAVVSPER